MSETSRNKDFSLVTESCRRRKQAIDFSRVGGLSEHIQILRDLIIVPLLHNSVYSHFNIKTPRGVLFYGPPGTGKTLIAGALATELNKEGLGKVAFYQRKGADVLDKWVGESEKKLQSLFELATKSRPSIIFFDELDGLAPVRSAQYDHVHCSVVTTLLALMDGLDSVPGVVVIGATNRIDAIDPALRRPGRFDREIYFPLPSKDARKEILQVHIQSWQYKPSVQFVTNLAELTTGFCGSDLQALCAEALRCAMTRVYPNIQKAHLGTKINVETNDLKIEARDFLKAVENVGPTSSAVTAKVRRLDHIIAPLLQRQLEDILTRLKLLWPHFFTKYHKYSFDGERYIGRLVLVGSNLQGLGHLVPAILQNFEHLPPIHVDTDFLQYRTLHRNVCAKVPSVLVIPHIDDLWGFLDVGEQNYLTSTLEGLHAKMPLLVITTHEEELPAIIQNFFYNNTSLIINIEDPTQEEIEEFFTPLFFGDLNSLKNVLTATKKHERKKTMENLERKDVSTKVYKLQTRGKTRRVWPNIASKSSNDAKFCNFPKTSSNVPSLCTLSGALEKKKRLSMILSSLLQRSLSLLKLKPSKQNKNGRTFALQAHFGDSPDIDNQKIFALWKRVVLETSKDMNISKLEVLYDMLLSSVKIHKNNFYHLTMNIEQTLSDMKEFN